MEDSKQLKFQYDKGIEISDEERDVIKKVRERKYSFNNDVLEYTRKIIDENKGRDVLVTAPYGDGSDDTYQVKFIDTNKRIHTILSKKVNNLSNRKKIKSINASFHENRDGVKNPDDDK